MKRLNPKTGKPFKFNDMREDGYIFTGYDFSKPLRKSGFYAEIWKDPIKRQITNALDKAKRRSKEKNIPFNLDSEYLHSIRTSLCPVFKIVLSWGVYGEGNKNTHNSPSLDRVIPQLGYVKGNVVFISGLANTIKQDVTETELYAVADWLHDKRKEVLNAFKDKSPLIPEGADKQSKNDTQHWSVPSPRTWEDRYYPDDYRRATQGENAYRSAKEGS